MLFFTHRAPVTLKVDTFFSKYKGLTQFPEDGGRVLRAIFAQSEYSLLDTNGDLLELELPEVCLDIFMKGFDISWCICRIKTEPG